MNNENGCISKLLVDVMYHETLGNELQKMITGSLKNIALTIQCIRPIKQSN